MMAVICNNVRRSSAQKVRLSQAAQAGLLLRKKQQNMFKNPKN
jgi:hypothetical protein